MNELIEFFNHPFFVIVGGVSTVAAICATVYGIYAVLSGIVPVWIRLGRSLHNRKIAVYAESDFESLKSQIVDSGIFKSSNIVKIAKDSIDKGAGYSMLLVNYPEFEDEMKAILKVKEDSGSIIIYAPSKAGRIEQKMMDKINNKRNAIVVNFRGRLLNDIVTAMITTTHEKK